jgi:hypothetical protein
VEEDDDEEEEKDGDFSAQGNDLGDNDESEVCLFILLYMCVVFYVIEYVMLGDNDESEVCLFILLYMCVVLYVIEYVMFALRRRCLRSTQ